MPIRESRAHLGLARSAAVFVFAAAATGAELVAASCRKVAGAFPGQVPDHLLLFLAEPLHEPAEVVVEVEPDLHDEFHFFIANL